MSERQIERRRAPASFSPTISMGNVLTVVTLLAALLGFWGSTSARLAALDLKVDTMWLSFSKQLEK